MPIIDPTERAIINGLQGGFPLTQRPFRDAGAKLGLSEGELLEGVRDLVGAGQLSRFGPLWNAEMLGGDVCLAPWRCRRSGSTRWRNRSTPIPRSRTTTSAPTRSTCGSSCRRKTRAASPQVIAEIEAETGLAVHAMPKMREFFVGFRVEV